MLVWMLFFPDTCRGFLEYRDFLGDARPFVWGCWSLSSWCWPPLRPNKRPIAGGFDEFDDTARVSVAKSTTFYGWFMLKHVETLVKSYEIMGSSTIYQLSINHLSTGAGFCWPIHSMLCHETKPKSQWFFEVTKEGPVCQEATRIIWHLWEASPGEVSGICWKNPAKHWISRSLLPAKVQYTQLTDLEKTHSCNIQQNIVLGDDDHSFVQLKSRGFEARKSQAQ